MVSKKYSYPAVFASFEEAKNERSEWEAEWKQISEYLLPGRGIYQSFTKPRKRKLTSPKTINTVAEDALGVLTSGMHGGLTSPSRPWFSLGWVDQRLNDEEPLKQWLQECERILHYHLHQSNFYSIINSFYVEYAGFGTGSVYVGEDTYDLDQAFRFELLTAGEYAAAYGVDGRVAAYWRTIFMTPRQVVERFPDTAAAELKKAVKDNRSDIDVANVVVLEYVCKQKYQDKSYVRLLYEATGMGSSRGSSDTTKTPLAVEGFYEMPYPTARWNTIGSDVYGVGPGSRALPDIKRLQEMEKAFLMATHKAINPPLNAPARMRNKINSLPGGENYYANPTEVVKELYQVRFDYQGVTAAIERVEQRIQRNFFNDIFLTAARDPNASPLRTGQVQVQEQEKMLRLGPVIERLQHEFLSPLLERCFNICLRKELFPPLDPVYAEMVGDYKITLISPLATAQRQVALSSINSFMAFLGQAAQFNQEILDNIDVDAAAREYADITGVKLGILRPSEDVDGIRQARQQEIAKQQERQQALESAQVGATVDANKATAAKTQAEAGNIMLETQQSAAEMGYI